MTFSDWPWRHWRQLRGEAPAVRLNDVVLNWRQLCAEVDALAIRFSHPRSGVHYYLRRVQ